MINNRVHELSHKDLNEDHRAPDIDGMDTNFIVGVEVKMRTGMLNDIWVVGSGLSAVIFTVVDDFMHLIFFIFNIDSKSKLTLFLICPQDAKFGLESLLYSRLALSGESSAS